MKVIIVGGGIAGLTFASALEKAGIDFVLLESRALFDPQVGASIGIHASGMRIIDQLGAAQEIIDHTVSFGCGNQRRSDGSLITKPSSVFNLIEKRLGYSTVFLDRQLVLRALNRTITRRDCMLLNKTVKQIEHDDSGVTVHCEDGTSHSGDVVVGCDGVNSKASVRSEMLRIASKAEPGFFTDADKTTMTAEYSCLFGISAGVTGVSSGNVDTTFDEGRSFFVITGKDARVFWFFFQKLDKVYTYGAKDYPRYSKADAEKLAEENAWRPCHGSLTLGDLWAKRVSYTLVPMEEALRSKWSWGRIAITGDTAHKMTANHGQAGNNAIESAASLANHLKALHDTGIVNMETINAAFRQWHAKRKVRIEATCKEAADVCRMQALANWKAKVKVFGLMPCADEFIVDQMTSVLIGAEVLEYLPVPERSISGSSPFNQAYGVGKEESKLKRAALAAPLLLISYWVATTTAFGGAGSGMLRLLQPASGAYYTLWLIESNRRANTLTILRFPLIFGILSQLFGFGVIAPCFYFIHYTLGTLEKFACADRRLTDIAYTRTILPIMQLGMSVALILQLTGVSIDASKWQTIFVLLPLLAITIVQWFLVKTGISTSNVFQDAMENWTRDLPTIRRTVYALAAVSGAVWMYNISQTLLSGTFKPESGLQWNWLGMTLASIVWLGLLFNDLSRAGMIGSISKMTLLKSIVIAVFSGPVASVALGWLWREEILASKKEKHAITREVYAGKSIEDVRRGQEPTQMKQNGHV